jgi:hypothetical protein
MWTVQPHKEVDGASIPQAFWSIIGGPFEGFYIKASVVHDHYCEVKTRTESGNPVKAAIARSIATRIFKLGSIDPLRG